MRLQHVHKADLVQSFKLWLHKQFFLPPATQLVKFHCIASMREVVTGAMEFVVQQYYFNNQASPSPASRSVFTKPPTWQLPKRT